MLETPWIPRYWLSYWEAVTTRRVRTISRKGQEGNDPFWNPQRPYVEHLRKRQMKIWSELHGDVESWAEQQTAQPPSGYSA